MSNDVLIAIPLFVFMGYLVERAAADRQAVQEPASRDRARARLARGGDHRHLRDLRDRDRHRRRGGDADGTARISGDAEGRLQHQGVGGRDHRRRLPRHSDSAVGAADRLWRGRRRSVVQLYAGAFFPGFMLAGTLYRLRHRAREVQARSDAAAARERARVALPLFRAKSSTRRAATRSAACGVHYRRSVTGVPKKRTVLAQMFVTLLPALFIAAAAGYHLSIGDSTGRESRHRPGWSQPARAWRATRRNRRIRVARDS